MAGQLLLGSIRRGALVEIHQHGSSVSPGETKTAPGAMNQRSQQAYRQQQDERQSAKPASVSCSRYRHTNLHHRATSERPSTNVFKTPYNIKQRDQERVHKASKDRSPTARSPCWMPKSSYVHQISITRSSRRNHHATCKRNLGRAHRPDMQVMHLRDAGTFLKVASTAAGSMPKNKLLAGHNADKTFNPSRRLQSVCPDRYTPPGSIYKLHRGERSNDLKRGPMASCRQCQTSAALFGGRSPVLCIDSLLLARRRGGSTELILALAFCQFRSTGRPRPPLKMGV
jgi:hypothetical protein